MKTALTPNELPQAVPPVGMKEEPAFKLASFAATVLPQDLPTTIPQALFEKSRAIARNVGGDTAMRVEVGKPNMGSFFNPEQTSITLDPLHIRSEPHVALFVPGHEGAHRAITRHPRELGKSDDEIIALYSQTGFGYIQNVVEDCAVNRWQIQEFPGMKEPTKLTYDASFSKPDCLMSTPEINALIDQLGFTPKFAVYGTEVLRKWHTGSTAPNLDPAVQTALDRSIHHAERAWQTIPAYGQRNKQEVTQIHKTRFDIIQYRVWNEVANLTKSDLEQAAQNSVAGKMLQNQNAQGQKQQELNEEKAKNGADSPKAKALQKELEELQKQAKDMQGNLPQEAIEQLLKDLLKQLQQGNAAKQQQKQDELAQSQEREAAARKEKEALDKKIEALEKKLQQQSNPKDKQTLEDLKEQRGTARAKEFLEHEKQKELQSQLDQLKKQLKQSTGQASSGMEVPIDVSQMNEANKALLREILKNMPPKQLREIERDVDRKLERLEDALNKELEQKLPKNGKPLPSHSERNKETDRQEAEKQRLQSQNKEQQLLASELESQRLSRLSTWDRAYEAVAPIVNDTYGRLRQKFVPEEHPDWEGGYASGQRIDLQRVMQAEHDPRLMSTIWQRRNIPTEISVVLEILVDRSGSMCQDNKDSETFKAVVYVSELFSKLKVPNRVVAFGNEHTCIKDYHESIAEEAVRQKMSILHTADSQQITKDAPALKASYDEISQRPEQWKFIVVLTDAGSSEGDNLTKVVTEIREGRQVITIQFGIGQGTTDSNGYYDWGYGDLLVNPDPKKMPEGARLLGEVFPAVIEDILRDPEKYFSGLKPEEKREIAVLLGGQASQAGKQEKIDE